MGGMEMFISLQRLWKSQRGVLGNVSENPNVAS